jgi:hypothetical protein
MTNQQLAAARKAANRFPEVSFRPVTGGVEVGGVLVPVTPNMSAEDVRSALAQQAAQND